MGARPFAFVLVLGAAAQEASPPFLDVLCVRARQLAGKEYVPPSVEDLPAWLAELDFDGYRKIRFREETQLWAAEDVPFHVALSHRGYLFRRRVPVFVVEGSEERELRFDPVQFQYGMQDPGELPPDLGYAGLTLLHPLERPGVWDEVASFRGASYFRILGKGQRYGASARGLAIDTATEHGEEFPEFVALWIEKPAPEETSIALYALLDSPGITGAYHFQITPGEPTVAQVNASLYPRREIEKLGLAPVTSMFLHGEQRLRWFVDYRPEVHDSDGLLVETADGMWLWRPLCNPEGHHRVTRIPLADPRGFGLMQRDRDFDHYADPQARFERRSSYWVAPAGSWGPGTLELVEIPSGEEGNDNVTVHWVPEHAPPPGSELSLRYSLGASLTGPPQPPLARVLATRMRPGKEVDLFVVEFGGPELEDLAALHPVVEAERGEVRNVVLERNGPDPGVRCAFELAGAGAEPVELRVRLRKEDRQVSETWVLQWQEE